MCYTFFNTNNINLSPSKVNGGFTSWTSYDECSELCGGGDQERSRSCTNPSPKHGGKDCVGDETQSRACNTQKCKGESFHKSKKKLPIQIIINLR